MSNQITGATDANEINSLARDLAIPCPICRGTEGVEAKASALYYSMRALELAGLVPTYSRELDDARARKFARLAMLVLSWASRSAPTEAEAPKPIR